MPELNISREKIAFLIDKAREFDVKDLPAGLEDGSNPGDEREFEVLEDDPSEDAVAKEMASLIRASGLGDEVFADAQLGRTRRRSRARGAHPDGVACAMDCAG